MKRGPTKQKITALAAITVPFLDRKMQVFEDIKKAFFYCKSDGKWYWHDRDEEASVESSHGPFDTFLAMIDDAVEPYEEEDEDG